MISMRTLCLKGLMVKREFGDDPLWEQIEGDLKEVFSLSLNF